MKLKKHIVLVLLTALMASCAKEEDVKTLRLGHGLDVSHSVHKAMVKMGEDLEKLSEGKLKLELVKRIRVLRCWQS